MGAPEKIQTALKSTPLTYVTSGLHINNNALILLDEKKRLMS